MRSRVLPTAVSFFIFCVFHLFGFPSMYITHNKKEANFLLRFTVAPKSYNLKISRHCPTLQTTTYYIINDNLFVLRVSIVFSAHILISE